MKSCTRKYEIIKPSTNSAGIRIIPFALNVLDLSTVRIFFVLTPEKCKSLKSALVKITESD